MKKTWVFVVLMMLFVFPLMAQDPIVDGGVYLIKLKANGGMMHPSGNTPGNSAYLRVNASVGTNRFWYVDEMTVGGEVYYRFRNYHDLYQNNRTSCVRLKDGITGQVDNNAVGFLQWAENDNAFLFKLVESNGSYAIIPYDLQNTNLSLYISNLNNQNTTIGLYDYTTNPNPNTCLWDFQQVEESLVLSDPIVGGPTLITEPGNYEYGGLTPYFRVYFDTYQYTQENNGLTYEWTAEGLPNGTTFELINNTRTLVVTSMPDVATSVTLTCTATKTKNGVVMAQSTSTLTVVIGPPTHITSLSEIQENGYYILDADVDAGSFSTLENFSGVLDGNFHRINGLTKPLFGTLNNAIVRNVTFDNIAVSDEGDVGAIAKLADGNSRIYNCGILATNSTDDTNSSTVSGTGNVGGLVGKIDGYTRVVNCYSYADITSGSVKAGIVGYNSFSSTQDDLRTMVVNCMFYGDIDTNGGTVSPVFGGERIYNGIHPSGAKGINTYDYFREGVSFDESFVNLDQYYNCWPADEKHLTRFEYYRNILNSNRRLCVWWIIGQRYQYQLPTDVDMIAKWVLDPSIAPYPILKPWGKYYSVINQNPDQVWDETTQEWKDRDDLPAYQGKKLGKLTVTVKAGSNNSDASDKTLVLPILDMDTLHHDYCYAKVQLPYYNEQFGDPDATTHAKKYGNNYTDKVVTGWKITSVTGGTPGTFVEDWESGYNFADRKCTNKDLYSVSKRVFAQGGYYYVPEDVTAITIEAYWGNAVYLHNNGHYMDRMNNSDNEFMPSSTLPTTFNGQTVYGSVNAAANRLRAEGNDEVTVYDQAIVLVGNYQLKNLASQSGLGWSATNNNNFSTNNKPFTITSVDLDFDNEPDYCMELQYGENTTRVNVHPIRFDFLAVPNLGLAIRTSSAPLSCGIFMLRGHFEITETAFMHTTQFEYDGRSDYRKKEAPVIFNGGEFDQLVSTETLNTNYASRAEKTKYFIIGGHAWMKEFTPGTHGNRRIPTRHCAVNVLGGEFERFYLSGVFRSDFDNMPDNPHCYTNGGKFGEMAGAGTELVDGDVTFKIDHSIIGEFYGGGINAVKPVTGSINVTIDNSIVGKYCGGPKMGNMYSDTEVVTNADNTIFGQYYGGGNGGTSLSRTRLWDNTINGGGDLNITPNDWNNWGFTAFTPFNYEEETEGYHAQFEFELMQFSSGSNDRSVARTYRHDAKFAATEVQKVTSELKRCTVLQDFYGGGNLGAVLGDVTSKLVNTTIWGSAYGGGFSATIPSFCVQDKSTVVYPYRDYAGYYHNGSLDYERDGEDIRYYTWIHELPDGVSGVDVDHPNFQYDGKWYCYTEESLVDLGRVEGDTELTIDGASKIYGQEKPTEGSTSDLTFAGAAFGGGNEARVMGNSTVNVGTLPEEQPMDSVQKMFVGNVYGGGKIATTDGNTTVNVYVGRIGVADENGVPYKDSGRVFGGGKGSFEDRDAGKVGGNSTVLMKGGTVLSDVYGGSELGDVIGDAEVTIENGTVGYMRSLQDILDNPKMCHVFGGGKGNPDITFNTRTNVENATVRILGGTILGSVYGGGEEGHVLGNVDVIVSGGNIGTFGYSGYDGNVFGGGRGLDVEALTAGSIGGNNSVSVLGGNILGSVYGGCQSGSVGVYFTSVDDPNYGQMQPGEEHGYITVNVSGGTIGHEYNEEAPENIGGNVYGGCKGIVAAPEENPLAEKMAFAKQTTVTISGTPYIRSSVFGGSEDGHILYNTYVTINGGQIGGADFGDLSDDGNSLHGNVYGGGRGYDRYFVEGDEQGHYCPTSGQVYGNSYLNIMGGKICRNVYGGGNMSSVGQYQLLVDENENPVLDDEGNTQYELDANGNPIPVSHTGLAQITISGGEIGTQDDDGNMHGNVFGSSRGLAGTEFKEIAYVHNTDVTITGASTIIKGSVFGGGEDGHVNQNTKVTVNNGNIGVTEGNQYKGNVYGGGRGIDLDPNGVTSPTAGLVKGHTRVYINGGSIINSVYGGGNMSLVGEERVVNINGGLVKVNVFGGSKAIPEGRLQLGMKTVNMRGGHVMGNVYGCNSNSLDGDADYPLDWTSFVNINGGEIDGNVFGAGYSCTVNGSVCVNIGKDAILNAPNKAYNLYYKDCGGDEPQYDPAGIEPTATKLIIGNSVYGGSDYYGNNANTNTWTDFIVSGYSNIYIDGTGYDTQNQGTSTEMTISGGLFGSSTHCESGAEGRHILLKAYGHRDDDGANTEFTHATRTLKTIQRCGNLVIDHSNVNFSGMNDISSSGRRQYSVFKVDSTLYMANASGFVLGSPSIPAYMDSIRKVRSVHLKQPSYSVYDMPFYPMLDDEGYWEWIGIKGDSEEDAHLYYYSDLTGSNNPTALTFSQENVLVFKGDSRLWVRYHRKEKQGDNWVDMGQYYGELEGFFRMRSPFQPWGTESFAYARPKISEGNTENTADGGFLSYHTPYNFFTDLGESFTNTHQHPYTNVLQFFKGDRIDYREWVIREFRGRRWYVDGTRGWGRDDMSKTDGWGLYPDMPKKTVSGAVTYDQNTQTGNFGGICSEIFTDESLVDYNYDYQNDIIYVVGALSAEDESALLQGGSVVVEGETQTYPLKLYRYPGGHPLNWSRQHGNEAYYDLGDGTLDLSTTNQGLTYPDANGPGANYGAMLIVQDEETISLDNVQMDGLYGHVQGDDTYFLIPGSYYPDPNLFPYPVADPQIDPTTLNVPVFAQDQVSKPMIVTHSDSELTLKGSSMNGTGVTRFGTILERGYNNTNADVWYTNSDYNDPNEEVHHGGGIYVNSTATVNVENVVTVIGNKQNLQIGSDPAEAIECNVYLPTFDKHLNIIGDMVLDEGTSIGVTSPIRNIAPHYVHNTFSPVAVALTQNQALSAWNCNNFHDDLEWFFSNESFVLPKYTYYSTSIPDYVYPLTDQSQHINHFDPTKTLFFGWTWNNVVRSAPLEFALNDIDSPYDLAWLISLVNGSNRQIPSSSLSTVTVEQTDDIDLIQYVWVPIGAQKTGASQFAGTYDGRGHLIEHLDIAYIGEGDRRYERANYGLFGSMNNGAIDRTFVVSGYIRPVGAANIGGLVGSMEGSSAMISNSEASVDIYCPDKENSENASGGLVGNMLDGEVHSSMAMPTIHANLYYTIGGLIGHTIGGGQGETAKKPKLNNSFANVKFDVASNASVMVGGLIGVNYGADMENCYLHLQQDGDAGLNNANFALLAGLNNGGKIRYSYAYDGNSYPYTRVTGGGSDPNVSDCYKYAPIMDADNLGYMYFDNVVTIGDKKVPMFRLLNKWVVRSTNSDYSSWYRPAIAEINGDLPVLLLDNEEEGKLGMGEFRSMATYIGGYPQLGAFPENDEQNPYVVLQYGGPVRDGSDDELNAMVERMGKFTDAQQETIKDYLYVYGDITQEVTSTLAASKIGKVSIHEDAAIQHPGTMSDFENTYVGVSFDNSYSQAYSTTGINAGLYGSGPFFLPRDWHMFSSPLQEAPLGFDYKGHNIDTYSNSDHSDADHYNNPWESMEQEFTWLNGNQTGNIRYWMKGWENSLSQQGHETDETGSNWVDGYFPSRVASAGTNITGFEFGQGWINETNSNLNSDEIGCFPYGMDFYTWTEPLHHWINFKRNGPNHWHSDENPLTSHHDHLDYKPVENDDRFQANVNEEILIPGRGYMMAISDTTFMQSHGKLNNNHQGIYLTKRGADLTGWNLVGNPYHAYLDFNAVAKNNGDVLSKKDGNAFYVIYDADRYETDAYVYYPMTGSEGGAYAGQFLHPHQGFYVLAEEEGVLQFTEDMTVARQSLSPDDGDFDGHFRGWKPKYPLVNLYLSSENGCTDVTVVEFERPDWGGARKIKELRMGNGLFYAQYNDTHYAAFFAKKGVERVPLWFEPLEDDVFTIKWETANGDFHSMYLVDNMTGTRYDMTENDSYSFQGHVGDYPSRFYITFDVTDVEEHEEDIDHSFAFFDGSQWMVTGNGELEFIDLQGRVLSRMRVSGGQSRVNLPDVASGMYLFRLTNGQETKIQKIIVNRR